MSVRCPDCGAVAAYGYEIGHKSDCEHGRSLLPKRATMPEWAAKAVSSFVWRGDLYVVTYEGNMWRVKEGSDGLPEWQIVHRMEWRR